VDWRALPEQTYSALEGNISSEAAYRGDKKALHFLEPEVIANDFLHCEEQKVDTTGCICFESKKYEVSLSFVGCTVDMVYDPFDTEKLTNEYEEYEPFKVNKLVIGERAGQFFKLPKHMTEVSEESSRLLAPAAKKNQQRQVQKQTDKYAGLRTKVKEIFCESQSRYGYRRVHAVIKNKGMTVSEKVIRRIMKKEQLVVPYKRRRNYNSYKGEISPAVENIINRDFHADAPNRKWLTDLTEFHIPTGKVYLSPIIDCFDGMVVSWTIGTSPDAELVNTMLDDAISSLSDTEHPIVHSDRGSHYRWPGWISRIENAGLIRSMSKKGCSPDNSACEGFFGRLKNEMFYYRSWQGVSIEQFIDELNSYLIWYNENRIKMSLGGMSPMDYRRSKGLVA
jgi:transposase InsO family protein